MVLTTGMTAKPVCDASLRDKEPQRFFLSKPVGNLIVNVTGEPA